MQNQKTNINKLKTSEIYMQKVTIYPTCKLKIRRKLKKTHNKKLMDYTEQNRRKWKQKIEKNGFVCEIYMQKLLYSNFKLNENMERRVIQNELGAFTKQKTNNSGKIGNLRTYFRYFPFFPIFYPISELNVRGNGVFRDVFY